MNQHSIQEAYFKNFCFKGKLWEHNVETKFAISKSAKYCTSEKDFQPVLLEKTQNNTIESAGIKSINKLLNGKSLRPSEFKHFKLWIALHNIRNQKFRNTNHINYVIDYEQLIDIEKKFSEYFKYAFIHTCVKDEYLITSDNPIAEFSIGNERVCVVPLSPKKLMLLNSIDAGIDHTNIRLSELINSILWANSFKYVYSDRKDVPYDIFVKNIVEYNLVGVFEESKFLYNEKGLKN